MTERDEERMNEEIRQFLRELQSPWKPQTSVKRNYIPGEHWEEKYDRLYREMKPREQFGRRAA